jgi:hypothetical protein
VASDLLDRDVVHSAQHLLRGAHLELMGKGGRWADLKWRVNKEAQSAFIVCSKKRQAR